MAYWRKKKNGGRMGSVHGGENDLVLKGNRPPSADKKRIGIFQRWKEGGG